MIEKKNNKGVKQIGDIETPMHEIDGKYTKY